MKNRLAEESVNYVFANEYYPPILDNKHFKYDPHSVMDLVNLNEPVRKGELHVSTKKQVEQVIELLESWEV